MQIHHHVIRTQHTQSRNFVPEKYFRNTCFVKFPKHRACENKVIYGNRFCLNLWWPNFVPPLSLSFRNGFIYLFTLCLHCLKGIIEGGITVHPFVSQFGYKSSHIPYIKSVNRKWEIKKEISQSSNCSAAWHAKMMTGTSLLLREKDVRITFSLLLAACRQQQRPWPTDNSTP